MKLAKLSPQVLFLLTFVGVIGLGWLLLLLPAAHASGGAAGSWLDHLFTATSAVSTTGLATLTFSEDYSTFGQVVVLVLFQLGGLGYVLFAALAALPGDGMHKTVKKTVKSGSYLPEHLDVRSFLRICLWFTLGAEVVGAVVLTVSFAGTGMAWGQAAWQGTFHSVSAFCTAGFGLDPDSLSDYSGNAAILAPVIALMMMGSIGFMAAAAVYERITTKARRLDYMTRAVVLLFAVALTAVTVLVWTTSATVRLTDLPFLNALFLAATTLTGAGFSSVSTGALGFGVLMAIVLPMCAGGAPSGTSGGIKLSNLSISFAALWSQAREYDDTQLAGEQLGHGQVREGMGTAFLYLLFLLVGIAWAFYLEGDTFAFEDLFFETVSAFGTVGLSRGITADLSAATKGLYVGLMFVGRVGVLTLIFGLLKAPATDA